MSATSVSNGVMEKVNQVLPHVMKFVNSKPITAIKEGFILTMPLTIVGSVFLLLAFLPISGYGEFMASIFGENWTQPLFQVTGATFDILALVGVFGIAYTYVKYEGYNGLSAGILAIVSMLIMLNGFVEAPDGTQIGGVIPKVFLGGKGMIAAIIVGLSVGWLYSQILHRNWTIKLPDSVPEGVSGAFQSLIPSFIIIALAFGTYIFFDAAFDKTLLETIYAVVQTPLQSMSDSFLGAIMVAVLISLLWWCGVHGSLLVMGVMGPILTANGLHNHALLQSGELLLDNGAKVVTTQFIDQFITVGGSGLTFGLVCCMVLFARSQQYKQLGNLAFVPGIFNINEPIIFATPIIFNPIMLIPFILAPVTSVVMVYCAISFGWVGPFTAIGVPWTTPVVLSGFIIGGLPAAILQVCVFLMTVCVYYPFFKYQDKLAYQGEKDEIALKQNETATNETALAS